MEAIRSIIEAEYGVSVSVKSWRSQRSRAAFALLARRVAAVSWPAIGKHLALSETGARRFALDAAKLERNDPHFREELEQLLMKINECGMRA